MRKIDFFDVQFDRLSVLFFYYLRLYPDFRTFTLKDLRIKIPAYQPAKDIDIEVRIDKWKVVNAINLEESINNMGEKEYKILKIDSEFEDIEIFYEIKEQVSEEDALKWIQEVKAKVYKKKAEQEAAFEEVLSKLAESEKVNDLKERKGNFVKWYENHNNPLKYYNVESPLNLAKKLSVDSEVNNRIPIAFSHFYRGTFSVETIFKDACEERFRELLPIEVLVEKINLLESKKSKSTKAGKGQPKSLNHSLKPAQITALFKALKGKYIASDTTLEQFEALFDSNVTEMVTPIQWLKEPEELVILLGEIYVSNRWQTYLQNKQAFKSREGTIITASTYSTYKSNLSQKEGRTYKEIRTLIERVKQDKH